MKRAESHWTISSNRDGIGYRAKENASIAPAEVVEETERLSI